MREYVGELERDSGPAEGNVYSCLELIISFARCKKVRILTWNRLDALCQQFQFRMRSQYRFRAYRRAWSCAIISVLEQGDRRPGCRWPLLTVGRG